MILFLKGFLIGVGKIIPGISGALIAIYFGLYEDIIYRFRFLFKNFKSNLFFLVKIFLGIIVALIIFSKIIIILLDKYGFIMMMFLMGLLFGNVYNFGNKISFNYKYIFYSLGSIFLILFISNFNVNFNNIYFNYFIAGVFECFSSIIPGISGTSLLIMLNMYDKVLLLISNVFNFNYFINNFGYYFFFILGIGICFICLIYFINYIISKYHDIFNYLVLGFNIGSLILLIKYCFLYKYNIISFIIGIMLFFIGMVIECLFDK